MRWLSAVAALLSLACSRPERYVYMDLTDYFLEDDTKGVSARILSTRIGEDRYQAFFVPGNGSLSVRLVVPPEATLRFAPMLPPGSAVKDPLRVTFNVSARSRGAMPQELWSGTRSRRSSGFRWVDVDLSRFAGSAIELIFETTANDPENTERSWAVWAAPRILST